MIVNILYKTVIKSDTYGDALLVHTNPIIDSPFGWGGVIDGTREILLLYPNNPKVIDYLDKAEADTEEYFEFYESVFTYETVDDFGYCYVHNSFFEHESFSHNVGGPVDLGLSVLWADRNVGASRDSDYGTLFGYGDPSADNFSEDESDYPNVDIVNTDFDIAKNIWGGRWRMPTTSELDELRTKCQWTKITRDGIKGELITGPNGNSIFLPFAGVRTGINTFRKGQWGMYRSGTLSKFGSSVSLFINSPSIDYGESSCNGLSVRPVQSKE